MAVQHVSMALRNDQRFEIVKILPNIGYQLRTTYFMVKDKQEPKVQKILLWSDFGPYKTLDDKTIGSLVKSFSSIQVNLIKKYLMLTNHYVFQHPGIENPEFFSCTESGILCISKYSKVLRKLYSCLQNFL